MKRIIISAGVIVFAAAVIVGATGAFFSDTETSTGNTFTAGAIDLQIDNESYYNGELQGDLSWGWSDLTDHLFFDFFDLKPGDWGEDTISIHVLDNDAWACAYVQLTADRDVTCTEPEDDAEEGDCGEDNPETNGDLADEIEFAWWADDGDNVFETDENLLSPAGTLGDLGVSGTAVVTLADSDLNIWAGSAPDTPLVGGAPYYIGKYWCFGDLTPTPIPDDSDLGPASRGSGFTCSGLSVDNASQSDNSTLDVWFTAIQSRNNAGFVCGLSD